MRERKRNCGWRLVSGVTVVSALTFTMSAFAGGQRPAVQKLKMQGETLTTVNVNSSGGVAQSGVAAAIYRSTACGFQSWIPGAPAWLDQQIHFNDGGGPVPLRSINFPVCYDTCHRLCGTTACAAGTCDVLGNLCDCLDAGEFPITANFQVWDGDPCGSGMMVAGAGGSLTIDETLIPLAQIGDGSSKCFSVDITVDPKVVVPHEVWVEANYGADDGWPLSGRATPGQGTSQFAGLNDGVTCQTFCDRGPNPILCDNPDDNCDWIQHNADSNAELFFSLQPRSGGAGTVVGQEIIFSKGGERVDFDIFVSDFDTQQTGIQVQAWQSVVDSSGYTSALNGTLTPVVIPCMVGGVGNQCSAANLGMGDGSPCNAFLATCEAGYMNCSRADSLLGCGAIAGCNVTTKDFVCAATSLFHGVGTTGADAYLWSLALDVSPGAKGTFTIDLMLPPNNTLLSTSSEFLPLIGVVPAQVTIELGQCCDLRGGAGNFVCPTDEITANGCAALGAGFVFNPNAVCDPSVDDNDECGCVTNDQCADGDACTIDVCDAAGLCQHTKVVIGADECCNDDTAAGDDVTGGGAIANRDDGNQCTIDTCSGGGNRGVPVNTVNVGAPCDDAEPCITVNDTCQTDGTCAGEFIGSIQCTTDVECETLTQGISCCNFPTGVCHCACDPPVQACCFTDGTCQQLDALSCTDQGGITQSVGTTSCAGDNNGDGIDDICDTPAIPAVTTWGLMIMTLLLIIGAKVYFNRRRAAQA